MPVILHWQQYFTIIGHVIGIIGAFSQSDALTRIVYFVMVTFGVFVLFSGGWYTGGV